MIPTNIEDGLRSRRARPPQLAHALLLTFLLSGIALDRLGHWFVVAGPIPERADVIVVLAGDYPYRIRQGIALYKAGVAPEIWYTGHDHAPDTPYSVAEYAVRISRQQGVPAHATRMLASNSTFKDAEAVARAIEDHTAHRIIVVTSWYHGRRALCAFERAIGDRGVHIDLVDTPLLPYTADTWWQSFEGWSALSREVLAVGYYWAAFDQSPWKCSTANL